MTMRYKDFPGAVFSAVGLGPRQVRAIASDASVDRDGDVLDPAGCDLSGYAGIVLACHDQTEPVGKAAITRTPAALQALITFARVGASRKADEFCALCKDGVLTGVSVGFRPTEPPQPRGGGRGFLFKAWELLEISLVAVPSNPNAVIHERAFAKDGRVLAGEHATSLERAHKRIGAGLRDMAGVIEAAGFSPTKGGLLAQEHADALLRAHKRIGAAREDVADVLKAAGRPPVEEEEPDPDLADEDFELAFEIARMKRARMRGRGVDFDRDRRRREIEIARMRFEPLSSAETEAIARVKLVERMRRGP